MSEKSKECTDLHGEQSQVHMELERRVDAVEDRLTRLETSLADMRGEVKSGFDQLGKQLDSIYSEKSKWSEWAREHIGVALKWIGWIVLGACGVSQTAEIVKIFVNK